MCSFHEQHDTKEGKKATVPPKQKKQRCLATPTVLAQLYYLCGCVAALHQLPNDEDAQ